MLQFLQLNDAQFQLLAQHAADVGLVLSEDVVQGAHAFNIEMRGLGDVYQGLANNVFAGLLPTMTAFVSGFAGFLKQHMADIVAFVVNAANFVMGVIGGLLGIDFQAIKLSDVLAVLASGYADQAKQQKSMQQQLAGSKAGEDALTKAIKAQIAAIDEQIKKIDEREAKRHASEQKSKLQGAIDAAQANLTDIMGNAPDTAGLSAAEAELAIQKHNQDIVDAQKQLNDAIQAMRDFDADAADAAEKQKLEDAKANLQKQLQAHTAAHSAMGSNVKHLVGVNNEGFKAIESQVTAAFAKVTASGLDWRNKGVGFANDIKSAVNSLIDTLLGPQHYDSTFNMYSRSGGLISALAVIAGAITDFAGFLVGVANFIGSIISGLPGANADTEMQALLRKLEAENHHDMGGYIPAGFSSAVGEYARESVYAVPGGGVMVDTRSAGPSSGGGDGHGHAIYLDGYLVGRAIDERNARQHRGTTLRPYGAT